MSTAQRVVVIVGLGAALAIGWSWWWSGEVPGDGGWFAYAPMTDQYLVVQRRQLAHLVVPLALVAAWTAVSVWLLGLRAPTAPDDR